ncbi:MAG: response regulator, partial [Kiritimatiellae bacterium]|nr:response regulator [Kiritimatiellia bacterium]
IVVDKMYGFLDANKYAIELFAELEHYRERVPVPDEIYQLFQKDDCVVELKDRFFELRMVEIFKENKIEGYSLLLADVTELQQLMDQLRVEKERADEANRAKSAFMSNMSHEIRTPMNAIVGMTEILMRSELPDAEREYLGNIQRSGNALLGIINDILDFSKIESGKMKITEDTYAPLPMLNDLKMIILNRIGSKMVQLQFDIDENLPAKLYGDELRIRQVLINIANNAVKFTERGFVRITVKIKEVIEDRAELFFSVEDSGQGIAQKDIGKLFGAYAQVDTKKNHTKEGTGLGLAISKQFVEMMGGKLEVKSEYGKGSEFYFTIPQKIIDSRKATEVKEEVVSDSGNILNFTAPLAKIMVVDDNEMNQKVAIGLLSPLKMQIDTAENGKQALDMICSKKYDLVFMDHMMPVMDGIEAVPQRFLRRSDRQGRWYSLEPEAEDTRFSAIRPRQEAHPVFRSAHRIRKTRFPRTDEVSPLQSPQSPHRPAARAQATAKTTRTPRRRCCGCKTCRRTGSGW